MEIFSAIIIHIVIPIFGISAYLKLRSNISKNAIPNPPHIQNFILFFGFGGWLLIFLTLRFWYWSGMAALGFFFLLLVMPFIIIGCIFTLFPNRKTSKYHFYALLGGFAFLLLEAGLWIFMLSLQK
jgi:hypothetical protein